MTTAVYSSDEAAERLAALRTWRWSTVAAGATVAGLTLAGALMPAAGAIAVAAAVILCSGAHLARNTLVDEWVLRDDLAGVPEVARARERLMTVDRRRELAQSLRAIAGQHSVSRHEVAPLLLDRLDAVRAELLAVATDLEDGAALDARTIAEITGLITDGARSPLLNAAVPESELGVVLRRIRFRIASARIGGDPSPAC